MSPLQGTHGFDMVKVNRIFTDNGDFAVYVDRGDPVDYDFQVGDLTTDGAWHDLDLSSIVPEGATLVHLRILVMDGLTVQLLYIAEKGNSNAANSLFVQTQVANIVSFNEGIVKLDSSRVVQYKASNTTWTTMNIVVRGWYI